VTDTAADSALAPDWARHRTEIDEQGFTVVPGAIDADLVDALRQDLERLEVELGAKPARNGFEGTNTVRIYNLLARGRIYEQVPVHANVLPLVEHVLDESPLISSLSSIAIDPGEVAQPIHADDQIMPMPKPHVATVCNSMWALTDFTEENGATRLVPGSHLADGSPDYGKPYDSVPAEMEAGSVLVWHGSLWHGGGANRTDRRRVGLAMNYCAGWIRQQENQQLGIPLDVAAGFGARLRELCGFGVYHGLIGHIDRKPPADRLLPPAPAGAEANGGGMVWDGA
jgi:ectoine hydroxylase-related dioxygenase (phytanoyl-CoA dioxygenase family)